jgi:RNA polymerase sigma-70 factor (ECF subfamily)
MNETPETGRAGAPSRADASMTASKAKEWFVREVLPLEPMLMHFLHQNWRNKADLEDIRQEVYAQVLAAGETQIPERTKAFVFATARNLLINRVHRERVVTIDSVADLDAIGTASEIPGPDRAVIARDSLRRLYAALEDLPPRCREAIVLRRIEGLSRKEIAQRMGISEKTVAAHITTGVAALADLFFGDASEPKP